MNEERIEKLEARLEELEDEATRPPFYPRRRYRTSRRRGNPHSPDAFQAEVLQVMRELLEVSRGLCNNVQKNANPVALPDPREVPNHNIDAEFFPDEISKVFYNELTELLNKHCAENASNTPDFVLAQYLCTCLRGWNAGVRRRESWYGR